MTQIKKLKNSQGGQVYPQTHTKAVIDDNGYTSESRLQAMQEEINQKQLEVGAVPSDLTPVEGSNNYVTSDGLYKQLNFGGSNVVIDLSEYTEYQAMPNSSNWVTDNPKYPYYGVFIPITAGKKYKLISNGIYTYYCFLTTDSHNNGTEVSYATGCTREMLGSGTTVITEPAPSDALFLYVSTKNGDVDRSPTVIEYNKKSLKEILENTDSVPTKDSENLVKSGGVYEAIRQSEESSKQIIDVEKRLFQYIDNCPEVDYAFSVNKFGTSASYKHAAIPVSAGEEYIIEAPSGVSAFYCFVTSNVATSGGDIPFIQGVTSATTIKAGSVVKVVIPDTCTYLLVYNSSNTRPFLVKKSFTLKKAQVKLGFDYILAANDNAGDFANNNKQFITGLYQATVRFIKTSDAFACKFNCNGNLTVFFYDSDFNYIGYKVITDVQANTQIAIVEERFKYSYIKFHYSTDVAFEKVKAEICGNLDDNWDVYNIRPSNGYHRIYVMVNVSDARCSDQTTSTVQDEINIKPNYGVIALPTTYSNIGNPTRLIIYCHGAGIHFTYDNSDSFDTQKHVDPAYWLAEGYAVMDIDGNPMDSSAHAFRPQAMSAYIAAYKWAIEHYNLCRDGVLLGGRSMGAGTVMYLLRSTCPIPVIAACANHPTSVAMGETASSKSANAELRGFILPEGFTFSDSPMTDEETQVFYDNWDKSLRYVPSLALCVDTPTTEEWRKNFIKNCCHVGEPYESNRIAACKDLHMVVRAPFKMFGCFEDPNNGYQATAQLYMTMLGNAGQQAEYRLFHSDKQTNYPSDSRTEHYYDLADPTLRTVVSTVYGEEVTNVPIVYVEMLQFWRRYEQDN